jgi:hypothetical protein
LQKIDASLHTISDSASKVSGDLKSQRETANATFKTQVQQAAQSITSAQSLTNAATAVTTAGKTLEASYRQAFAGVKC